VLIRVGPAAEKLVFVNAKDEAGSD